MTLCVNCVTRGRPDYLRRTLERTLPNISREDTVFMVSCDEDDEATVLMLKRCFKSHGIIIDVRPREDATSAKYNRALEVAPQASLYVNLSDYNAIVTPKFDQILLDTAALFPDNIGVVVNPPRNASFSDLYAMTRGMVDKLGWYAPPFFSYWFWDHWVDDLARYINRLVMAPVMVEYDRAGKPMTQGMQEPAWWATWFDAAYAMRRGQAMRLIDAMDEPSWRKVSLIANMPLLEHRSRLINGNVRANARDLMLAGGGPPKQDDRYRRVREAATVAVPSMLSTMAPEEAEMYRAQLLPPDKVAALPQRHTPQSAGQRLEDLKREYRHENGPRSPANQVGGLLDLVNFVKPESVLEIGSHRGVSTEAFALTCKQVVAIDPWPDAHVLRQFKARMAGYANVMAIQGYSPAALEGIPEGMKFDLVYIDGDHSYEAVAADIAACQKYVKPGGHIAGHDYNGIAFFAGVKRAVNEEFSAPDQVFEDESWLVRATPPAMALVPRRA